MRNWLHLFLLWIWRIHIFENVHELLLIFRWLGFGLWLLKIIHWFSPLEKILITLSKRDAISFPNWLILLFSEATIGLILHLSYNFIQLFSSDTPEFWTVKALLFEMVLLVFSKIDGLDRLSKFVPKSFLANHKVVKLVTLIRIILIGFEWYWHFQISYCILDVQNTVEAEFFIVLLRVCDKLRAQVINFEANVERYLWELAEVLELTEWLQLFYKLFQALYIFLEVTFKFSDKLWNLNFLLLIQVMLEKLWCNLHG